MKIRRKPYRTSRKGIGGPKTPRGKSISRWNATRHNTWGSVPFAQSKYFRDHQERCQSFLDDLVLEHQADGPSVYRCVEEMGSLYMRIDQLNEYRNSLNVRSTIQPPTTMAEKLAKVKKKAEDNKERKQTKKESLEHFKELLELLKTRKLNPDQNEELKGHISELKDMMSFGLVDRHNLPASFWSDFEIFDRSNGTSGILKNDTNGTPEPLKTDQEPNSPYGIPKRKPGHSPEILDAPKEQRISMERCVELLIAVKQADFDRATKDEVSYAEQIAELTRREHDSQNGDQSNPAVDAPPDFKEDENLDRCETYLFRQLDRVIDRLNKLKRMTKSTGRKKKGNRRG